MQLNVWNDLAKAKRRWTEKKSRKVVAGLNPATPLVGEEEGEESEGSGDPVVNAAPEKDKSGPESVMMCPCVQPTWRKSNVTNAVRQVIFP